MALTNKAAKEEFVSNLEGTSPWELLLIASIVPLGLYVFLSLHSSSSSSSNAEDGRSPPRRRLVYVAGIEFLSFWVPAILAQSVWSYPWTMVYFVCLLIPSWYGAITANPLYCKIPPSNTTTREQIDHDDDVIVALGVTIYRACLLCLTCVAILAVDFTIFPRRLAKTEVYGYGWMDLGAASFVIAAGVVAAPARRQERARRRGPNDDLEVVVVQQQERRRKLPLKRILPVLFMGTLRLVTHKNIDYQEHASEYGVHWNFFFTLAFLTLLSSMVSPTTTHRPTILAPCLVLGLFQVALSCYGLQHWIETAPRSCGAQNDHAGIWWCDLFVANREGILGCIGYGSLYFISEWIASVAVWTHQVNIWWIVAVLVLMWLALDNNGSTCTTVSRRSTNATFCVWVLLVNVLQLASIQTVLVVFTKRTTFAATAALAPPPLLDALNRNGLLAFVIANLLTGLVNLSFDTLHASHGTALLVVGLYMAAVSGIAVALERVKTTLRDRSAGKMKRA
jgi:glucosaminylphosphatidylinositol acyltransferase